MSAPEPNPSVSPDPAPRREMPALGEMSVKTVIRKAVPLAGRRIGDFGCGNGALTAWLRREGAWAIGVEPEPALLRAARSRHGGLWLASLAEQMPLATASLHAVVFFNSLHHIALNRQVAALAEAARVLAPGGDLLVIEPAAEGSYFALLQPLDDESGVRAAAQRAVEAVAGRLLQPVSCGRFATFLDFTDVAAVIAAFTRADASRARLAAHLRPTIERQFVALGEPTSDGRRRFCQPMLLHHLCLAPKKVRRLDYFNPGAIKTS